jgi:hypothetical protein
MFPVYEHNEDSASTWYHKDLIIDNIQIFELPNLLRHPDRWWIERLDTIIKLYILEFNLKRLSFVRCYVVLPGLLEWIQTRASAGQVLENVTFRNCQCRQSWMEYQALQSSELVPYVKWE